MKTTVEQEPLATRLKMVAGFADPKSPVFVLGMVRLAVADGTLTMTATDLSHTVTVILPAEIAEPGMICTPVDRLHKLVASLRHAPVILSDQQHKLLLKSGRTRALLDTVHPDDLPVPSNIFPEEPQITVPAGELDRVIGMALPAIEAGTGTRPALCGLALNYTQGGGGGITAAATNGRFGAVLRLRANRIIEFPAVILPRPLCQRLRSLLREPDATVAIAVGQTMARIAGPDWSVTTKLIAAEFPDPRHWSAPPVPHPVIADSEELAAILARIDAGVDMDNARLKQRGAIAEIRDGTMTVRDGQDAVTDLMPVEYNGGTLEIAFNTQHFSEAIKALDTPQIEIHAKGRAGAIRLCAKGEQEESFSTAAYRAG